VSERGQAARIWTTQGFVENRLSPEKGAVFMSPEEATGKLGSGMASVLVLESGDEPAAIASRIHEFDAIVLRFAVFSDGRGFSTTRLLREKLGYEGEIRAEGHFLLDQIPLMLRVGFTSFAVTHGPTIRRLETGRLPAIALYTQPAWRAEQHAGQRSWTRRAG
jgi:phosphoadenosine phosphosulfate reductase